MADEGDSLAIAHIEDVTEQRQTAEQMEWAATHDGLTGLPNRFRFLERLGITSTRPPPGSIAVLFIDLDNFKVINDSLGHDAGDQLLRAMSDRLRTVVRDRDLLGRFGGDEFIVMLRDISGNTTRSTWPSACVPRSPNRCSSTAPNCSSRPASASPCPTAKASPPARCCATPTRRCTGPRPAAATAWRCRARQPRRHGLTLRTTNELRRGLERGEIVPYYQPIVQLDNGHLVGFEVLGPVASPRPRSARARPVPADGRGDRAHRRRRFAVSARVARPVGPVAHARSGSATCR